MLAAIPTNGQLSGNRRESIFPRGTSPNPTPPIYRTGHLRILNRQECKVHQQSIICVSQKPGQTRNNNKNIRHHMCVRKTKTSTKQAKKRLKHQVSYVCQKNQDIVKNEQTKTKSYSCVRITRTSASRDIVAEAHGTNRL